MKSEPVTPRDEELSQETNIFIRLAGLGAGMYTAVYLPRLTCSFDVLINTCSISQLHEQKALLLERSKVVSAPRGHTGCSMGP